MKKRIMYLFFALVAVLLVACGQDKSSKDETKKDHDKLQVVTSFYPMYEFTKQVAGDRADVSVLVSGGASAHHYEPSAKDIAQLSEADLFVYSSDQMEFWAKKMLTSVENKKLEVVKATNKKDMLAETGHDHEGEHEEHEGHEHENDSGHHDHEHEHEGHDHGGVDPHNWLDPQAVSAQVDAIKTALIKADPKGKDVYEKNAKAFQKELKAVDEAYESALKNAEARTFVVQHQAFSYLAHRYHLEQVAASGINTEAEPSPQALAEINEIVKTTGVPVIYYQSGSHSKIAETIAKETDTEIAVLYDLERAPQDVDDTKKDMNYIDAMKFNLKQLQKSIK